MNKETRTKLVELIRNNPELEVIVFAEQDGYEEDIYIAEDITSVRLDKYVNDNEGIYRLLSDYVPMPRVEEDICEDDVYLLKYIYPATDWDEVPDSEILKTINSIVWKDAIIIYCSFR